MPYRCDVGNGGVAVPAAACKALTCSSIGQTHCRSNKELCLSQPNGNDMQDMCMLQHAVPLTSAARNLGTIVAPGSVVG